MKNFTKLFCAAALFMMGAVSANAGERVDANFDNVTFNQDVMSWDADNMTFSWSAQYSTQLHGIAFGDEWPLGDITGFDEVVVNCDIAEGTEGYRLMFYTSGKGTTAGGVTVVTESGEKSFALSDFNMDKEYLTQNSEICLSGYNASGKVKVNSMYLVKSDDPAAGARKILNEAIIKGSNVHELGWTPSSFSAVTNAVSAGQSIVEGSDASAMTQAAEDIEAAINNLSPQNGFEPLTKDMYNNAGACSWEPYKDSGLPYGDGNVDKNNYADLSSYEYLMIGVKGEVRPRLCMNRLEDNGQQAATKEDSKMLDINSNNEYKWSELKYQTIGDNGVYSIDLKAIVADYGYAYLHSIKKQGWGPGVIVGSMMLTNGVPNVEPISTGIKTIDTTKADNTIYDLQGRRVTKAVKGVYVIDGKKVIR